MRRLRSGGPSRFAVAAALLLAALAPAGCGSSPTAEDDSGRETSKQLTKALAAVKGLGPREREAKLAKLAKEEGGVTVYHTLNQAATGELFGAFEDKYDIDVSSFDTSAADLLQRVSQETRSGLKGVDVVETGGPEMYAMANDGVFADFRSPYQKRLAPGSIRKGWTADRFSNFTIAWNTDRVKPGEQPRSWEELAEPKWKGRMSIAAGTVGVSWYKTLRDYWVRSGRKSGPEADRVFEQIARNSAAVPGTSEALELLGAGEFDVSVAVGTGSIEAVKSGGAPVAWKPPMNPIVQLRAGAGLVRDAPNPAAAMLFLDYLYGKGQDALAKADAEPARRDLAVAPGAKTIPVDLEQLVPEQEKWSKRWDRIVGQARQETGG
jgi:iron(III) transport system substrate-binding protein